MDDAIIEFKNVSMHFECVRRKYGLKSMLLHVVQYFKDKKNKKTFTALDNVSFAIRKGERVGIIGHNGCGKTTTLSLIGGVFPPSDGEVVVNGRVSMMLALGAGFNKQLSGRDNIILNGVLQGKTRAEMRDLMDDIISFAGLGDFIDAPLYTYSSGMLARIGFGVATAIKPDILLVDEVMAVGDANFKAKCKERIDGLLRAGTTLILVSHNPSDIKTYCNRVIKLDHGKVVRDERLELDKT